MSVTIRDIRAFKDRGERFVMLTAYDYPTARLLDQAGIPAILVGDSVGDNILGYPTTVPVTMEEMLHHCRAVARGARNALLVGDMPFGSYQVSVEEGLHNAIRFLKEGGMHAVKIEGPNLELTQVLTEHGIPVMAHLGLTPQSVHALGGYRVQARREEDAHRLLDRAMELQKAGAFSLVLEAIPAAVAREVTQALAIPTIGIGAGVSCDAQVLVVHDLVGLGASHEAGPKFVKRYANLGEQVVEAAAAFKRDVEAGAYPDEAHSY
jgi:3-methyl-2-oxobutanoate hydroxymethyltransferase